MTRRLVRAIEAHAVPQRPPLALSVGDVVTVGRRDDEWPAFVYVTNDSGSGWVPSRHLSASEGEAVVLTAYDTTELATTAGEFLELVERDDDSGWHWCRSRSGRAGWVPSRTLAAVEPSEG